MVPNLNNWNLNELIGIFNVKFEIILVEIYERLREKVEHKVGSYPTKNSNDLESNNKYQYLMNLPEIANAKLVNR